MRLLNAATFFVFSEVLLGLVSSHYGAAFWLNLVSCPIFLILFLF